MFEAWNFALQYVVYLLSLSFGWFFLLFPAHTFSDIIAATVSPLAMLNTKRRLVMAASSPASNIHLVLLDPVLKILLSPKKLN